MTQCPSLQLHLGLIDKFMVRLKLLTVMIQLFSMIQKATARYRKSGLLCMSLEIYSTICPHLRFSSLVCCSWLFLHAGLVHYMTFMKYLRCNEIKMVWTPHCCKRKRYFNIKVNIFSHVEFHELPVVFLEDGR